MKLSIVTINYNDAVGLKKTLASVATQKPCDCEVEHIVVDGGSADNSVDTIKQYPHVSKWISERDKGVYDGMNKGIKMATGDYIQILNSGDVLASSDVICKVCERIEEKGLRNEDLIYGNMIKRTPEGIFIGKSGKVAYSLLNYFTATLNHDCCWIKRSLFEQYGLYDENLKIVSDWKWFLQAIGLGHVKPVYVDIDMTIFDTTGISERNLELRNEERRKVLGEVLPPAVLADYDKYAFPMHQIDRLKKHHLYGVVYFIERVLFKFEKWGILK